MPFSGGGVRGLRQLAVALAVSVAVASGCGRAGGPVSQPGPSGRPATGAPDAAVPLELRRIAEEAVEVRWGSESAGSGGQQAVEVTDARIVRALAAQLAAAVPSEEPPDGSYRECTLQLTLRNGDKTEALPYLLKGPTLDMTGYIRLGGRWYEAPAGLGAMLHSMDEYRPAGARVDAGDERFLSKHGWTPLFLINEFEVNLPSEFVHRPGEFPSVLYWAYNNEFGKDIGLDLIPHLGQKVDVRLYKVAEILPEFMKPRRECGRAVVVRRGEEVVGGWLDAGRHHAFACSLSGRRFEDITDKTWDEWIPGLIDRDDMVEQTIATLAPEEVIRRYYHAIDRRDYQGALSLLTRKHLLSYLFSNMDNKGLYNSGFDQELAGTRNTSSAKIESIKGVNLPGALEGSLMYQVEVYLTVKKPVTHTSGRQTRFVTLRRETPETGWRIDDVGTGP